MSSSKGLIGYYPISNEILFLTEGDFRLIPFSYGAFDIDHENQEFNLNITFYRLGNGAYEPVSNSYYLKTEEERAKFEETALALYRQLLEEQEQIWKSRGLLSRIWGALKISLGKLFRTYD